MRPIGAGRRLDHVRDEALARLVVEVAQVLAAAAVPRLAVGVLLDDQLVRPACTSLPSMWLRRSKSPRWAMPSSSPNSPGGEEREGIFDVGRAARIVAQLVGRVVAQPQPFACQMPRSRYQL